MDGCVGVWMVVYIHVHVGICVYARVCHCVLYYLEYDMHCLFQWPSYVAKLERGFSLPELEHILLIHPSIHLSDVSVY